MTWKYKKMFIDILKKRGLLSGRDASVRKNTVMKNILNTIMILLYPAAVTVISRNIMLCQVSLFVTMFLLMSDPGGIYYIRLRTMFSGEVILAAEFVIARFSVNIAVFTVFLVFAWSFLAGMLNVFGIRGNRLSSIAVVSFVIFLLSPHKLPGIFAGITVITGGFIWISAVRLWRWPLEPDRPLFSGVAEYLRLTCPVDIKMIKGTDPCNNENKDKLFRLDIGPADRARRLALLMIRDLKGSGNPYTAGMYRIIKKGEMIFSLLKQLESCYSEIPDRDLYSTHLRKLVRAMCVAQKELAVLVENFLSPASGKGIDSAVSELAEEIQHVRNIISDNNMQDVIQWNNFMGQVEKYPGKVSEIAEIVLKKGHELSADRQTGTAGVKTPDSIWILLKNNMSMDSEIFRHSLRSGIVLAFVTAMEILLKLPHGYWITLSAAIILKPGSEESLIRARERIAGTTAGCVLAFFITLVFRLKFQILSISVISVLIAFRNRPGNYFIYAVFWTLALILIIDINNIDNRIIAVERIVYTLTGGILAIGAVHFIFPVRAEFENS